MNHSLFEGETFDPFLTSLTASISIGGRRGERVDSLAPLDDAGLTESGEEVGEILSDRKYASARMLSRTPWSISLTHSLFRSRSLPDARQSVNGSISFHPTTHWRLTYTARYSFDEEKVQNQRVTLRRDLHRWELLLSFNDLPDGRFSYELRVNLIDLPSLELKHSVREF
jgi:hypothetical protein